MRTIKSQREDIAQRPKEQDLDARYLKYFEYFNRQLYFEAHAVLEELWLPQRRSPENGFYKGLIQLAGAFVHLQKDRPGPASALLLLAQANLSAYPPVYHQLDLERVLGMIVDWLGRLKEPRVLAEACSEVEAPTLRLEKCGQRP